MRSSEAGQTQDAEEAREAGPSTESGREASSTQSAAAGDRVEISDAARAAQSSGDAALVERGRHALEASSLPEERLAELQQRVESGYYTEPEAHEQIAEGLAKDLGGSA